MKTKNPNSVSSIISSILEADSNRTAKEVMAVLSSKGVVYNPSTVATQVSNWKSKNGVANVRGHASKAFYPVNVEGEFFFPFGWEYAGDSHILGFKKTKNIMPEFSHGMTKGATLNFPIKQIQGGFVRKWNSDLGRYVQGEESNSFRIQVKNFGQFFNDSKSSYDMITKCNQYRIKGSGEYDTTMPDFQSDWQGGIQLPRGKKKVAKTGTDVQMEEKDKEIKRLMERDNRLPLYTSPKACEAYISSMPSHKREEVYVEKIERGGISLWKVSLKELGILQGKYKDEDIKQAA